MTAVVTGNDLCFSKLVKKKNRGNLLYQQSLQRDCMEMEILIANFCNACKWLNEIIVVIIISVVVAAIVSLWRG